MSRARRIWRLLNANCLEMSRIASESLDRDIDGLERFALRSHNAYCAGCRRYLRHIRLMRLAVARLSAEAEIARSLPGPSLPEDARERIKRLLQDPESFRHKSEC